MSGPAFGTTMSSCDVTAGGVAAVVAGGTVAVVAGGTVAVEGKMLRSNCFMRLILNSTSVAQLHTFLLGVISQFTGHHVSV